MVHIHHMMMNDDDVETHSVSGCQVLLYSLDLVHYGGDTD